jgi:hypothetical protein
MNFHIIQQPENCENRNDPDLVKAFLKKWWVESDFKAPNLPLSLRLNVSSCHYVLASLLFLLYVNDIADNLLSLTRLFADDTSLSYSSQSPYTIEDVMNSGLESIYIWSKQWLVNQ